jgi:hypothetical protein
LLLEAHKSFQAGKQHRDSARQHRKTIEKLFRTCEFS